ncbi:site-specific tyrosine recombinase XerC [Caulifigura coniformis]|uniref:Site-specific tyrosine recombinase XerC n=1 Tax=Caulifigura coniformis TaxID=2527983 RepID=A0A517SLP2_9PLAN|nr:tyrosine-type recombinase/integrase [Caulifigura coniformis]QDT57043.1 site-specific tyrosine recombinase XerC [Caulifigura coniformis]
MAGRIPKPWFRKARGEWYVTVRGVKHRLGPDKAEADRQCLLLRAGQEPLPKVSGRGWLYASEVADRFQCWVKAERSQATLDWYCQYLQPFKKQFVVAKADDLTIDAVRNWVNGQWSSQASRRAALRSVKAAFRKAAEEHGLVSPLSQLKLPGETAREYVVSRDEFKTVLAAISDASFADLVRFVWITGCRPQEAFRLEDQHVDLKKARIVFPKWKSKGKAYARVIWLPPEAAKILRRLLGSGGLLFRTKAGKPYTKDITRMRFRTLEKTLGFRYCLYHFRHGFAHRSLAAGNDALTVATLMGHRSTQTLAKTYAHLNQADDHLRSALRKSR